MRDFNLDKPPVTNRGVVNTNNSDFCPEVREKLKMCVDWCQATIFDDNINVYDLFKKLFGINSSLVLYESVGLYGYDNCFYYKDIKIYSSSKRDDMGFHIYLTGSACRSVEELGINFIDLFRIMRVYNCHFTRLDIAIDNFSNEYFTMNRVKSSILNNSVISKFKNTIEFLKTKISDGSNRGYTIWFGSRASKLQIVFYDKLKERESQNYIVDRNIKYWCRLEIRFRDEYATEVAINLIEHDFNLYIKSVLSNYIKFIDLSDFDKNRSRKKLISWWSDFLGNVPKVKLYNNGYVESIVKKQKWLEDSTSRSFAMVLLSSVSNDLVYDDISCGFLIDYFNKGFLNITPKDLQLINEYRIRVGKTPLLMEDFKYLVGEIKDILIERK